MVVSLRVNVCAKRAVGELSVRPHLNRTGEQTARLERPRQGQLAFVGPAGDQRVEDVLAVNLNLPPRAGPVAGVVDP